MNGWFSVDDSLPEEEKMVFISNGVYVEKGFLNFINYLGDPVWIHVESTGAEGYAVDVTHWAPMLEPPNAT
jgi:hypothetical protein